MLSISAMHEVNGGRCSIYRVKYITEVAWCKYFTSRFEATIRYLLGGLEDRLGRWIRDFRSWV